MTRLEHVAFWCADLDLLCDLDARHFGAVVGPFYENLGKASVRASFRSTAAPASTW